MNRVSLFLVVALSGRALAASARKAGHRVVVLDLFNDLDTRAEAEMSIKAPGSLSTGFDGDALIALAGCVAPPDTGLVYGSGFESRPELLAELAARRRLYGNSPETLARIKDPVRFFGALERLGVPHPETRLDVPVDRRDWLAKKTGAAGGAHIRDAEEADADPRSYFQRWITGRSISALFVADGCSTRVLGFSEQWSCPRSTGKPFRFAGAAMPARLPSLLERTITDAIGELVADVGLIGVNSADMLVHDGEFYMLEINPRPGATVDIFDRGLSVSLFDLHVRACNGELPGAEAPPSVTFASEIVYAVHDLVVPPWQSWPAWATDLPEAGTRICEGEPVCTVLATGPELEETKSLVRQRANEILAAFRIGSRAIERTGPGISQAGRRQGG